MITPDQVTIFSEAAKPFYTDEYAYHNWHHAEAVMRGVTELCDRAEGRGLKLARGALLVAAAWHDAGYDIDHKAEGFATKEYVSAHLLAEYLQDKDVSDKDKKIMDRAILGTTHGFPRKSLNTLVLHRADIANIGGPYEEFLRSSLELWEEHDMVNGKSSSWQEYLEGTEGFIGYTLEEAQHELPRLGEPLGTYGSYDVQALANFAQLSSR